MDAGQWQETDSALIWYDDFNGPEKNYTEASGAVDHNTGFGESKSLRCVYNAGAKGEGNRKVFFGDSPYGVMVRSGESFDDVYWRIYVMHQYGWQGGQPAKLSRATSMVSGNWSQAMIAHVWGSGEDLLTLDPATGVTGGRVVTTQYNDFSNLRWLGNKPATQFRFSSAGESGWWVCVEARARLNTPGVKDGLFQLWIDGKLESQRTELDWRGTYTAHGINAVFLEAYWNSGSPVYQSRWYDNFVISTSRIGPVVTSRNPTLFKRGYHGPGTQAGWEVELAADRQGETVLWKGVVSGTADSVRVDQAHGTFSGPLEGRAMLDPGATCYARVRQQSSTGAWSRWSGWHQEFLTGGDTPPEPTGQSCDYNSDGVISVADVIMLLIIQRDGPGDLRGDYNEDGRCTVADAIALLIDIMKGKCPLPGGVLLSAVSSK